MALYSKNPGHWRVAANGSLKPYRPTIEKMHSGGEVDGALKLAHVPAGKLPRQKRVKRIPLTREETRMTHSPGKNAAKNARKRAAKRNAKIALVRGQKG